MASRRVTLWTILIITLGKVVASISTLLRRGYGGTWPGEIALTLQKDFTARVLAANPRLKIVLVTGTNGKTTTAKLITHALRKQGLRVFSNATGANLLNGIASIVLRNANIIGKIDKDVAVFELDENVLAQAASALQPSAVVLLNLFRDQLDRYGELDNIIKRWSVGLAKLPEITTLIINGQDPNLFYLGKSLDRPTTHYFGLEKKELPMRETPPEADALYCPICYQHLTFEAIGYSHIGNFHCPNHGGNSSSITPISPEISSPVDGLFNRYNVAAAALVCQNIFGVNAKQFSADISDFTAAFGRQEIINYQDREFHIQLSKNPTGFNQSISLVSEAVTPKKYVLIMLNNRIPDGRDVSWIWDVNYEQLVQEADRIWVTGDRVFDMAIRLTYAIRQVAPKAEQERMISHNLRVHETIDQTLDDITAQTNKNDAIYVLPVYSAMLDLRQKLVGGKIT